MFLSLPIDLWHLTPVTTQGQGVTQRFDGYLLNPETKPQGREKWSFHEKI